MRRLQRGEPNLSNHKKCSSNSTLERERQKKDYFWKKNERRTPQPGQSLQLVNSSSSLISNMLLPRRPPSQSQVMIPQWHLGSGRSPTCFPSSSWHRNLLLSNRGGQDPSIPSCCPLFSKLPRCRRNRPTMRLLLLATSATWMEALLGTLRRRSSLTHKVLEEEEVEALEEEEDVEEEEEEEEMEEEEMEEEGA